MDMVELRLEFLKLKCTKEISLLTAKRTTSLLSYSYNFFFSTIYFSGHSALVVKWESFSGYLQESV